MLTAGQSVDVYPPVSDDTAVAGRLVRITVPVGFPERAAAADVKRALEDAGQQLLQGLLDGGSFDGDVFPNGSGADLTVEGELRVTWPSEKNLRSVALSLAQNGAEFNGFSWVGFGTADVSALDLDGRPKTVRYNPTYYDPSGDVNPDGSLNYSNIVAAGTRDGIANLTNAAGSAAASVASVAGAAAGGAARGLGSGLGLWGTVFLVLALIVAAAVLVYLYVPGAAGMFAAARGGA